ncbi:MAG TPA: DNA gyrase C-terminal beta-propeller domain-containing protein, partial [Candidatus Saccharimonadales bacterium]|nr:DNA gyrase C-terminal beta-propeller domain-containing protein [Candidatus Saccharimonadales bacterium]
HDFLLFFTNKGRVFRIKTYEVPAASLNAKGVALVNLLQLQPEETVSSVINISKTDNAANLIMCTIRGVVKKTPFEQYQNVRSSGLIAIRLDDGDELKWIRMTTGDNEVIISTAQGQAIRFHEKGARPMGRVARGVRGIRLRPKDRVIGMDVVEKGADIFVISKYGYGKRTSVDQFTPHARGGVGIRSAVVNDKTGDLVGVKRLDEDDGQEVILISKAGQTIRLGLADIPSLGRATQGVRIMRLNDGDEVVSLALVDKNEEGDDEAADDKPALVTEEAGAAASSTPRKK